MAKVKPPAWAARFEAARSDAGVSLAEIAQLMGKTPGGVRHWLNGHRQITLAQFLELCECAKVDAVDVLYGPRYVRMDRWEQIQGAAKTILEAKPAAFAPAKKKRAASSTR